MQTPRWMDFVPSRRLFFRRLDAWRPVLFFSSARPGLQGEGLAAAGRRRRSRARKKGADQPFLPLEQGELITTIHGRWPEDEQNWGELDVMFRHHAAAPYGATSCPIFVDVRRSGMIAMKLDEGEAIVDVQICTERDDVLLTSGQRPVHLRFPVRRRACVPGPAPRWGVRGNRALAEGDKCLIYAVESLRPRPTPPRRNASAYLKARGAAVRRGRGRRGRVAVDCRGGHRCHRAGRTALPWTCRRPSSFVLTVSEARGSASVRRPTSNRTTGRGGKGIRGDVHLTSRKWAADRLLPGSRRQDQIHAGHQWPVSFIRWPDRWHPQSAGRSTQGP